MLGDFFTKKAPTFEVDIDTVREHWVTIKLIVERLVGHLTEQSRQGKISLDAHVKLIDLYRSYKTLEFEIDRKFLDREVKVDWDNIKKALKIAAEIVSVLT